jgi:hypothetical protein
MDIDISKYLKFLSKEGWSDLIDERWKEDVKKELLNKYPSLSEQEWKRISDVVFMR